MKVEVNFEKFKREINKAVVACMKTGANPSLKGIFLEAMDSELVIRSTNIDVGFESSLKVKCEKEGKFLILGEVLARLLASVSTRSNNVCILEYENNTCTIYIDEHNFKLKTLSYDIFPNLPSVSGVEINVESKVFLGGLKSVIYSVAKSEIKPEISGIFVKFTDSGINFVATDAYRLAEKVVSLDNPYKGEEELNFIIPEKNVKDILRIVDVDYDGKLDLVISKNSLQMKVDDTFVVSRLIEGNFPNYTQIIPSNPVSFAIYLKEDLIKSLRILTLFSDKTQQINLNITTSNTEIEASNQEVGSTKEVVNSTLKGEPFSVKLNSKYLEEFLQNISDSSVVVKFTAQNKAIIVQGIQDASYTYLLMPSYR
jgi:DNA polymerase-3 subunit beta